MVNFLKFAKEYAAKHGITYKEAVKSDKVKCAFHNEGKEKYCEETPTTQVNVYCNGGPTPEIEEEGPMGKKDLLPKKKVNFGDMPDQPPGGPMPPPRRKAMPPRQIKKEDPNNIVMDLTNGFPDVPPVAPRKTEPAMPLQKFKTEDPPLIKPGTVPGKDDDVISVKPDPVKKDIIDLTRSDDWNNIANHINDVDDISTLTVIENDLNKTSEELDKILDDVFPKGQDPPHPDPGLGSEDPDVPGLDPEDPDVPGLDPEEDEDEPTEEEVMKVVYEIIMEISKAIYASFKFGYDVQNWLWDKYDELEKYGMRYPAAATAIVWFFKEYVVKTTVWTFLMGMVKDYSEYVIKLWSKFVTTKFSSTVEDATGFKPTEPMKQAFEDNLRYFMSGAKNVTFNYVAVRNVAKAAGIPEPVIQGAEAAVSHQLITWTYNAPTYMYWFYQSGYLSPVAQGAVVVYAVTHEDETADAIKDMFWDISKIPAMIAAPVTEFIWKPVLNRANQTAPQIEEDVNQHPHVGADGFLRRQWEELGDTVRGIPGDLAKAIPVYEKPTKHYNTILDYIQDKPADPSKKKPITKVTEEKKKDKGGFNLKAGMKGKRDVKNFVDFIDKGKVNPWLTDEERAMAAIEKMQDPMNKFRQVGDYSFDPNQPVTTLFQNPNINPAFGATINGQPVMLPGDMNLLQGPQIGFGNGIGGRGLKRRKNIDELPQVVNFQLIL